MKRPLRFGWFREKMKSKAHLKCAISFILLALSVAAIGAELYYSYYRGYTGWMFVFAFVLIGSAFALGISLLNLQVEKLN